MSIVQIRSGGVSQNQALVNDQGQLLVQGEMSVTNPSIGTPGQTAPTMTSGVAGVNPSGKLTPLQTDTNGALITTAEMVMVEGFNTIAPGYPVQIPVGTNSTVLLPVNPLRAYAHVINNSSYKIYVQYGVSAALRQGFPVTVGSALFISGNDLYRGAINAISPVANTLIDVLEGEA